MKTDELLRLMSADLAPEPRSGVVLARWIGPALGVSAAALMATLGLREGLASALSEPLVALKMILPIGLAALAIPQALRLARPGAGVSLRWLWSVPAIAALALVYSYVATPQDARMMAFTGKTIGACLIAIPILALPLLAAFLWALRNGAPLNPTRAGAVAGLAAGGLAAGIYALHCTEDSPLFYATWYSLGIVIAGALGAGLGARLLRW